MQNPDEQNNNPPTINPDPPQDSSISPSMAEPTPTADTSGPAVPDSFAPESSSLNSLVPSGDTVGTNPPVVQNYVQPPNQGSSHKKLLVGVGAAVVTLLVAAGAFAFWYFGVRVSNTEYERASAVIDVMIADAESMESAQSSLKQNTSTTANLTSVKLTQSTMTPGYVQSVLGKIKEAKDKASEYLDGMKKLESFAAIQKDDAVKAVYDANKKVIDEFGVSSDELYKTTHVFFTLIDRCIVNNTIVPTDKIKDSNEYDQQVEMCKDYLEATETVPSKEFNDSIYVPYRGALLGFMLNVSELYKEVPNSSGWNRILGNLKAIEEEMKKIDTSKIDSVNNSQNPKTQLRALKTKLDERKEVFFR